MLKEHLQVLVTLYEHGKITRQQMKTIRGLIISMNTDEQREVYLRKVIYNTRNNNFKKGSRWRR